MGAIEHLPPPLKRHRLKADEYQQLGRLGLIAPEARVELLDGEIIEMAPIGTRHWAMVSRLAELLQRTLGHRAIVSAQSSFRLDDFSEPEPDVAVFNRRDDFYATALPTPADTLLVIEVADTSARYDREIKLPRYARGGVPEVWIVDLDANLLHIYRQPQGEDYLHSSASATPGVVEIAALAGIPLDLTGLLG